MDYQCPSALLENFEPEGKGDVQCPPERGAHTRLRQPHRVSFGNMWTGEKGGMVGNASGVSSLSQ